VQQAHIHQVRLFQAAVIIVVLAALDRAFTGGRVTSDVLWVFAAVFRWISALVR